MSLTAIIDQLLIDMDTIRPVVIAAMPDDQALRARTRRMISHLETIRQSPAVPLATYLWLSHLTSRLLDAEHGALLKPAADGLIPETSRNAIKAHVEQRQTLIMQALQDIPRTLAQLDRSSERIGHKAEQTMPLPKRAQHLDWLLCEHLQNDVALKGELQQLIAAFTPSMSAIASVLEQVGEGSPELNQALHILEQDLPEDVEEARNMLRLARQDILHAGTRLATASKKLNATIQEQVEKLTRLSSQLQQAESEARNDPLTGLPNRRRLAEFLNHLEQPCFCFLIIDIDYFKKINDSYGHDVGDEVLQQLAITLKESIRDADLVARIGGEEFCVVYPDANLDISYALADTLRRKIASQPFHSQRGPIHVTVSIGVAEHSANTSHGDTLKAADQALYQSKRDGRNRVSRA